MRPTGWAESTAKNVHGNYVRLYDQSADALSFMLVPDFGSWIYVGIEGFQIVGLGDDGGVIPEPAGLGLIALSLLAVSKRRR